MIDATIDVTYYEDWSERHQRHSFATFVASMPAGTKVRVSRGTILRIMDDGLAAPTVGATGNRFTWDVWDGAKLVWEYGIVLVSTPKEDCKL